MSHTDSPRDLYVVPSAAATAGAAPRVQQSWDSSAAEQASGILHALRAVQVPVGVLQAVLLLLGDLVVRPDEAEETRAAAREICAVLAGLTDLPDAGGGAAGGRSGLAPVGGIV